MKKKTVRFIIGVVQILIILITALVASFTSLCFAPSRCLSADFTVNPVNVFFDVNQKTTVLTITNNADQPLTLQVGTVAWTQDDEGNDVYSPSEDIIVFPRIFTVVGGQQRIVRIGVRVPAVSNERTYRIYMEEVPPAQDRELRGAVLTTLMKVSVPLFISPLKALSEGKIEKAGISNGTVSFSVVNKGNLHYIIRGVKAEGVSHEGATVFRKDFSGWYVLSGRSKKFSTEIPHEVCIKITNLKIEVTADILSLRENLIVRPEMCSP